MNKLFQRRETYCFSMIFRSSYARTTLFALIQLINYFILLSINNWMTVSSQQGTTRNVNEFLSRVWSIRCKLQSILVSPYLLWIVVVVAWQGRFFWPLTLSVLPSFFLACQYGHHSTTLLGVNHLPFRRIWVFFPVFSP